MENGGQLDKKHMHENTEQGHTKQQPTAFRKEKKLHEYTTST